MRVEDHGYWQGVSIDTEMALRDPAVIKLFTNEYGDTQTPNIQTLIGTIDKVVFEHKPAEHLTLIDAANILSLSVSVGATDTDVTLTPEEKLVNHAAKAYVHDVANAVMAAFSMFNLSGHTSFSEYIKEEFKVTPCTLTNEGREESVFILTIWLSHYEKVSNEIDDEIKFGRVSVPRGYGQGFCFPNLKRFALEDARLRKKIPSLVGASPDEVKAYLTKLLKDKQM